jgi:hypothetical protein
VPEATRVDPGRPVPGKRHRELCRTTKRRGGPINFRRGLGRSGSLGSRTRCPRRPGGRAGVVRIRGALPLAGTWRWQRRSQGRARWLRVTAGDQGQRTWRISDTMQLTPDARDRLGAGPSGELQKHALSCKNSCAPGRIRTCGLLLRRQTLYPLSYGGMTTWLSRRWA